MDMDVITDVAMQVFVHLIKKNSSTINILGDSISDSLLKNLILRANKNNFKITHMSYSGNLYFPNFVKANKKTKKIEVDDKVHKFRENKILSDTGNSYIIVVGQYSYYFEESEHYLENEKIVSKDTNFFYVKKDDFELNKINRIKKLKENFKKGILNFANKDFKILLLYPLPQSLEHVSKKVFGYHSFLDKNNEDFYKKLNDSDLHINYSFFKKKNKEIFDFFDQINHKNVYKIYPHKLFCNTKIKNKCIFHSKNDIFFFDRVHLSYSGSELVNQLIFDKINKIENKN